MLVTSIFSFSYSVFDSLLFTFVESRYHTIPTFNHARKKHILKTLREKEKMLVTSIFSFFPHNVFHPFQTNFNFSIAFILSSVNAFNLEQSINLSSGNGLRELQPTLAILQYIQSVMHMMGATPF